MSPSLSPVQVEAAKANIPAFSAAVGADPTISHFCLLLDLSKRNLTVGRVFIVELSDSSRRNDIQKESGRAADEQSNLRSLRVLTQCISGIANGADHRMLPFKDTRVARILQHPLAYAAVGRGAVAVISCMQPDAAALPDTLCTLNFTKLCSPREALKNISEYKDLLELLDLALDEGDKRIGEEEGKVKAARTLYESKVAELAQLQEQLRGKEKQLEAHKTALRRQATKEHKRAEASRVESLHEAAVESRRDLQTTRKVIDGTEDATEQAIQAMATKHDAERREYRRKIDRQLTKEREALDAIVFDIEAKKRKADQLKIWEQRVQRELEQLAEEEAALQEAAANATGPSRTAGMTDEEIAAKAEYFSVLDMVDQLEEENDAAREMIRKLKAETRIDIPTDSEESESEDNVSTEGSYHGTSRSSSLPPSPASSRDSSSSSSSDTSSAVSSASPTETTEGGGVAAKVERKLQKTQTERNDELYRVAYEREKKQFRHTCKMEREGESRRKQIYDYLTWGTYITRIVREAPYVKRCFAFLGSDRKILCIVPAPHGKINRETVDKGATDRFEMRDIKEILLGQTSQAFEEAKIRTGADPGIGATRAKPKIKGEELHRHPKHLGEFFYQSLTLDLHKMTIDFITDDLLDFDSWTHALHHSTNINPNWGRQLNITTLNGADKLTEKEIAFCSENHITPLNFLNIKSRLLSMNRLLITVYDLKLATQLDFVDVEKLFEFFVKTGHIESLTVWVLQYKEKMEENAKEKKEEEKEEKKEEEKEEKKEGGPSAPQASAPAPAGDTSTPTPSK